MYADVFNTDDDNMTWKEKRKDDNDTSLSVSNNTSFNKSPE